MGVLAAKQQKSLEKLLNNDLDGILPGFMLKTHPTLGLELHVVHSRDTVLVTRECRCCTSKEQSLQYYIFEGQQLQASTILTILSAYVKPCSAVALVMIIIS